MRWVPAAMVVLIAACAETTTPAPSVASAPPAPLPAARPVAATPTPSGLTPAQQAASMVDRSMGQDTRDTRAQAARPGPPSEGRRNEFDLGAMGSYPTAPSQAAPAFRGL